MTHTIAPPTLEELNRRIATNETIKSKWSGNPGYVRTLDIELYCLYAVRDGLHVNVRQIVCEEWHKAVKEFSLRPGSHIEIVIGRIINRLDNISTQSPWMVRDGVQSRQHSSAWKKALRTLIDAAESGPYSSELIGIAFRNHLDALRNAISPSTNDHAQSPWMDIETAPKDGCFLVQNRFGQVCPAQKRDGDLTILNTVGYADWEYGTPISHWQPLPKSSFPPTQNSPKGDAR